MMPAYWHLVRLAAAGDLLHNDDTTMRILDLEPPSADGPGPHRTGVFTSGIVSVGEGRRIALFFTGRKHAPLQMCDGLDRNLPGELETILGNCLAHGRRKFVEVVESFPEEVKRVLGDLKKVYKVDDEAKKLSLSDDERLQLHKERSGPVMEALKKWLDEQVEEKLVEPNSGLGQAIAYMRKRWEPLTLFLREPGAPLDNNLCERALKKAILHRRNAMFFKTENGARVGDLYMSLIHTCELNDANPFEYLVGLQRNAADVEAHPELWMPWSYRERLEQLAAS
ncbi:MAG: IS66 family transposase [bacterium]|nr:IS66 family transposase [bacterium]